MCRIVTRKYLNYQLSSSVRELRPQAVQAEPVIKVHSITQEDIAARYPQPLIRGERITRLGEKDLGRQGTDADTCRMLGEEQIGWLIGAVPSFERMIEHVRRLNDSACGARWVVVPATKRLSEMAFEQWFSEGDSDRSLSRRCSCPSSRCQARER